LKVKPDKVYVSYLAPKKVFSRQLRKKLPSIQKKYNLPNKFVLYVGDINYNKNIPTLIKACKIANLPLVICGKQALEIEKMGVGLELLSGPRDWFRFLFNIPHPELAHFRNIKDHFKGKMVKRLGFVPDEDLSAIYSLATVYCQPSFAEGFGLPTIEAMASGVTVVASKIPPHLEVVKGAALYFSPRSPVELAKKLKGIVGSKKLRGELIKKGAKRAKLFSWEKTAKETIALYKHLANENR